MGECKVCGIRCAFMADDVCATCAAAEVQRLHAKLRRLGEAYRRKRIRHEECSRFYVRDFKEALQLRDENASLRRHAEEMATAFDDDKSEGAYGEAVERFRAAFPKEKA